MIGRRMVAFAGVSIVAVALAVTLWGKLVAAQDSAGPSFPANQDAIPSQDASTDLAGGGPPADPNIEVLTRGAIHEAFAQPVVFNAAPSAVVAQKPPDPVEEMPPDQKPEGNHVNWIPGYWSWEGGDQNKYVWCSGIWRAMPANCEWVPGYWTPAESGYQWVCGFWRKSAEVAEVTYLPQRPPETLENGPVGNAPSADYVWVPGVWIWRGSNYAWRAGFWAQCNPDWIWVPSYYAWTPSGYVFVEGRWDYAIQRRGLIFAPVVFRRGVYFGAGYVYSPTVAMDFNVCTGCLFCRPGCGCYCFGDYYGPAYAQIGIYPWFSFHSRFGYDPVFAYYNWHEGPRWRERIIVEHRFRLEHVEARPARTFVAMRVGGGHGPALAVHVNVLAARRGGGMRFERVSAVRREEIHRAVHEVHVNNEKRMQIESRGFKGGGVGPTKMSLPKSSLASSGNASHTQTQTQGQHAPPNSLHQQQQNKNQGRNGNRGGPPPRSNSRSNRSNEKK